MAASAAVTSFLVPMSGMSNVSPAYSKKNTATADRHCEPDMSFLTRCVSVIHGTYLVHTNNEVVCAHMGPWKLRL